MSLTDYYPILDFGDQCFIYTLVLMSGFTYNDFLWWFGPDCLGRPASPPASQQAGLREARGPLPAERVGTKVLADKPKAAAPRSRPMRPPPRQEAPPPEPEHFTGGWAVPEMPPGYEGFRQVGSGGFADVFYARRKRDGLPVAIKRLRRTAVQSALSEKLFRREVDLLSRLQHRAFPRLYSQHLEGEHPYYVMEFIDGTTLGKRIRERGAVTSRRAALVLGLSVSDALAELHRNHIVHRDLTPANIMIAQAKIRVIDLGIGKDLDSLSTPSDVKPGTLGFYAPEYLVEKTSRPTMDVFSWGASIGYALTGMKPYGDGLGGNQLLPRVLDGKLDSWFLEELARVGSRSRIFGELELIVRRCLRVDPTKRPADGLALSAMVRPLMTEYERIKQRS